MLDIYTDLTQQIATFGGHIEIIEVDKLSALRKKFTPKQITDRVVGFHKVFDVQPECAIEEPEKAAKTSLTLDKLVEIYQLGSMAYCYEGTGIAENEDTMSSAIPGNSLLTANGIPVTGE